jgi:hypothetical protein
LENISGADVLNRPRDGAQVLRLGKTARQPGRARDGMLWSKCGGRDVGHVSNVPIMRTSSGTLETCPTQPLPELIEASLGAPPPGVRLALWPALGDDPRSAGCVIPGDHYVVQPDRQGRYLELVVSRQREAFELPTQIIAE